MDNNLIGEELPVGVHVLLDIKESTFDTLNDLNLLLVLLRQLALDAQMTILAVEFHQFKPQGVSVILLLSESHISIHTWPERGIASVDLYTCNLNAPVNSAIENFLRALNSPSFKKTVIFR